MFKLSTLIGKCFLPTSLFLFASSSRAITGCPLPPFAPGCTLPPHNTTLAWFDIATSALNDEENAGNGPFYYDVKLTVLGTDVLGNNRIYVQGGGGAPYGLPTVVGGASGSLESGITITQANADNGIYQSFTPGTHLFFQVTGTFDLNQPRVPFYFSASILDKTMTPIPTTGIGNTLFFADVGNGIPSSETPLTFASGTGTYSSVVTQSAPIPAAWTLFLGALSILFVRRSPKRP